MRARVAYISSLGTTAILVAAALLMLAVVGAIVAFRGWPGAANAEGVRSVPLTSPLTRTSATLVVTHVRRASAVVRARPISGTRLSTAGLVKQVGPGPVVAGVVKVTSGPGAGPSMNGHLAVSNSPSFPAPAGRNPVTVQLPQTSTGGDSSTLVPVGLPGGGSTAPVTGSVGNGVGQVVGHVPSPPTVVESVRDVVPIH